MSKCGQTLRAMGPTVEQPIGLWMPMLNGFGIEIGRLSYF